MHLSLSSETTAALEAIREIAHRKNILPGEQGWISREEAGCETLARVLLDLFPVHTFSGVTIRWDDQITPERLIASGFTAEGNSTDMDYSVSTGGLVFGKEDFRYVIVRAMGGPFLNWIVSCPEGEETIQGLLRPGNMGDVWRLMASCGIPLPTQTATTTPTTTLPHSYSSDSLKAVDQILDRFRERLIGRAAGLAEYKNSFITMDGVQYVAIESSHIEAVGRHIEAALGNAVVVPPQNQTPATGETDV